MTYVYQDHVQIKAARLLRLSGAKSSRDKGFKESGGQGKVALIYSGSLCLFSLKKGQLYMPSDPRLIDRR